MGASRKNTVSILREAFRVNPSLHRQCLIESKKKIKQHDVTRIFDTFPDLVSADTFVNFQSDFINLLEHILKDSLFKKDPEKIACTPETLDLIKHTQQFIAIMGCGDLLKNEMIHPDICKLLEWEPFIDEIDISNLIVAYVGTISMKTLTLIITNNPSSILSEAIPCLSNCISINCHEWVIESIIATLDKKNNSATVDEEQTAPISPVSVGIMAGMAGVTLAAIGYLFFGSSRDSLDSNTSSSEEKSEEKTPEMKRPSKIYF